MSRAHALGGLHLDPGDLGDGIALLRLSGKSVAPQASGESFGKAHPEHPWQLGSSAMEGIFATVGAAIGIFAGTNVDDLVVLTVLFLSARATGRPRTAQIWVGQYLGIAALVAISVVAALGLAIVPDPWVGLLGLVPLALGLRGLVAALRHDRADVSVNVNGVRPPAATGGLLAVAGVTVANGADNISVYTPVFRTIGAGPTAATIGVFAVGVALWCLAATWLASHKKIIEIVERWGHWLVPVVFITIGLVIVVESGVLSRLV